MIQVLLILIHNYKSHRQIVYIFSIKNIGRHVKKKSIVYTQIRNIFYNK